MNYQDLVQSLLFKYNQVELQDQHIIVKDWQAMGYWIYWIPETCIAGTVTLDPEPTCTLETGIGTVHDLVNWIQTIDH